MNWQDFLEQYNIPFVTRGPNTKRGEVSIQCPWCGEDDPSEHLGINLTNGFWGCHRSADHRGKSPTTLIAAVLGCSFHQAKLLAGQFNQADPDTLGDALALLQAANEPAKAVKQAFKPARLPDECRAIKPTGTTAKFWHYLKNRGFNNVDYLISKYRLKCCLTGKWKDRVIIPVFDRSDALVEWTARAITKTVNAPRYLTNSNVIKTLVYNEFNLVRGGDLLFIAEGPFDALKIDYYGEDYGANATCVFGTSMTLDQVAILTELAKRFKQVVTLFDPEAVETSFSARDWILGDNVSVYQLPPDIEDPGSMTKRQIRDLIAKIKHR